MKRTVRRIYPWEGKLILKIRDDREPREIKKEDFDENIIMETKYPTFQLNMLVKAK